MYSLMTVAQLKDELKKRKASVAGKKAVLIQRLEAYDRNANFGAEEVEEDEAYNAPGAECFRDINGNTPLPPITKQHIQAFVERFQAQLKGRQMYEERFLLTARAAAQGDFTYIQGQCKAQMKKMFYVVNAKLNSDGSIEQSNCECAAGSGVEAHCKHVLVLLQGVEDMVRTKTIILHQVCTQKLMSFKRPRKIYFDSPKQAQKLPCGRKRTVNYLPLKEEDIMDNYNDHIKNMAVNLANTTMPILQMVRPANPYAIENDHQYAQMSLKEKILRDNLLKKPTTEEIGLVERSTRNQRNSKEWFLHRSCRITASNFHAVTHSKQSTQKHLAQKMLYPKPFVSRATTHGVINESVAIQKYCQEYDLTVEPCGLFISATHPFLGASPDGLLGDETIIEVKCPYAARNMDITVVSVPYLEEVNGEYALKKNHPYYTQIQGQLFCSGRKYCNLIIYTFKSMKVVYVYKDEAFIANMVSLLEIFYKTHFENALLEKILYKNYEKLRPNRP